jgi:protoheme IX farnesyltransferase
METLKTYYRLTKPGIVYGNLMFAAAGFLLAADGHIKIGLLLAALGGQALIIASACVFNNIIDRDVDKRMARTQKRAMVQRSVSIPAALTYGAILCIIGFGLLVLFTNWLTVLVVLVGFIVYVFIYAAAKRWNEQGTLIGSIAGSVPPVGGYVAVTNQLDGGALLLFLILTFWQMPHFYAIATYRLKDYRAASLPVLTVKKGIRAAKLQTVLYIVGFTVVSALLTVYGYTGYVYLVIMLGLGIAWLRLALLGFRAKDDNKWGKQVFLFSLLITVIFSALLAVNAWLP